MFVTTFNRPDAKFMRFQSDEENRMFSIENPFNSSSSTLCGRPQRPMDITEISKEKLGTFWLLDITEIISKEMCDTFLLLDITEIISTEMCGTFLLL